MAGKINIHGAVVQGNTEFFVLIDPDEAEDNESVLAIANRENDTLSLTPLSDFEEIVSLATFAEGAFEGAKACALTADGRMLFCDGNAAWSESVPNESVFEEGTRIRRRMRTVHYAGDTLYATGFANQVYRRKAGQTWQDISFDHPEFFGGQAVFYNVVVGASGAPIFAGVFAHSREVTEEMKAASAAGNFKLFRELKRAAKKPDCMLVAEYRDGWKTLFTDYPSTASWLSFDDTRGYILVADSGVIWKTKDFQSIEELWSSDTPGSFSDIKNWKRNPVFLFQKELYQLGPEGLDLFEPGAPTSDIMSLWPGTETMIAAERDAVWVLERGGWTKLTLKYALG